MRKKVRAITLSIIVICLIAIPTGPSQAFWIERQKGVPVKKDFMLGPTSFQINGRAGDEFVRELQVTNRLGKKMGFVVEFEDFAGSKNPNEPTVLQKNSGSFSARNWFKAEKRFFILKQGEKMHFNIKIKISEIADPGEHYAAALVRSQNLEPIKKGVPTIRLSSRLGSMFLIDVGGKRLERGSFTGFKTTSKFFHNGPVKFNLVFSNRGNTHLEPAGKIIIRNMRGKITAKVPVRKWIVLRQAKRAQEAVFKRGWLFGKYTAEATVWWGSKQKYTRKKIVFYAFPFRTTLYIIIGFFVAAFFTDTAWKKISSKYKLTLKLEKIKEDNNSSRD